MNETSTSYMQEATRLTRAGRLDEAMALIKRHLGLAPSAEATPPPQPGRSPPPPPGGDPGDGWMDRLKRLGSDLGARLGVGGALHPGPADRSTLEIEPDGGRFLHGTCTNAAGSRGYRLYVPASYSGRPLPLLVMLHGCTQSPEDFAAGTGMNRLAAEQGLLVAYPAQPASANPQRCWNWFKPADQARGQGEPSLIAGITRQIMAEYAVDPARVYVAGLSAGGAQAAIMGAAYPDLYAAIGVHSGLACGAARDLPSALAAMRQGAGGTAGAGAGRAVPTIVFHGDRDTTVNPRNAALVMAEAEARTGAPLTASVEPGAVPGGHAYERILQRLPDGRTAHEQWVVHGAGHAWSGGRAEGSFTDPRGPDASAAMLRFFLAHPNPAAGRPA
jgi:poly(hydroxyalkanoate) depolymerase family esterase